jgi:hypothetical protein
MKVHEMNNREMFSVVRDLLLEGSPVRVSVKGQSMLPFFRSGSTVALRPIREEDFRKYNVVLADTGRNFVIHRIISLDGDTVTLLGDGNIYGTESMTRDKVYGIIDCSRTHIFFARIWLWLRPVRRFPLAIIRRVTPR